jgi:hypothetical protein
MVEALRDDKFQTEVIVYAEVLGQGGGLRSDLVE